MIFYTRFVFNIAVVAVYTASVDHHLQDEALYLVPFDPPTRATVVWCVVAPLWGEKACPVCDLLSGLTPDNLGLV